MLRCGGLAGKVGWLASWRGFCGRRPGGFCGDDGAWDGTRVMGGLEALKRTWLVRVNLEYVIIGLEMGFGWR
jgi:hypothetical protein